MSDSLLLNMSFVILISSDDYEDAIDFMKTTSIAFDSLIILNIKGALFEIYRINPSWDILSNKIGDCNDVQSLALNRFDKRTNLNGTSINSSLVLMDFPYDGSPSSLKRLLDSTYEPEVEILSRLGLSLHLILEEINNFKISFDVVKEWGAYIESLGHWDHGMFREIELNKADIGLTISRIFSRRLDVSYFFPPLFNYRSCFIFKHPSTLAAYTALLKPFTVNSWMVTIACIVLCSIALWFVRKFSILKEPQNDHSFMGCFLIVLGANCQQGLSACSLQLPTRIMTFFLLFGGLQIFTVYGAAVVGFLLSPSPKTIKTLDKLIQSPLQKYAEDLVYHKTHFMNPFSDKIEKAYQAIKGKTPDQDRYIDIISGIKNVQKGGFALYAQDTNLYAVIDKTFRASEICSLAEIPVLSMTISTVIRKKSPFKEFLYRGMILLRESGLLDRETRKWNTQRPECMSQEESVAVTLEATVVAHIIYATGFLLAVMIFLVEIQMQKLKNYDMKLYTYENLYRYFRK